MPQHEVVLWKVAGVWSCAAETAPITHQPCRVAEAAPCHPKQQTSTGFARAVLCASIAKAGIACALFAGCFTVAAALHQSKVWSTEGHLFRSMVAHVHIMDAYLLPGAGLYASSGPVSALPCRSGVNEARWLSRRATCLEVLLSGLQKRRGSDCTLCIQLGRPLCALLVRMSWCCDLAKIACRVQCCAGAFVKTALPSAFPVYSVIRGFGLAFCEKLAKTGDHPLPVSLHLPWGRLLLCPSCRLEYVHRRHWDHAGVQSGGFVLVLINDTVAAATTACNFCASCDIADSLFNRAVVCTSLLSGGLSAPRFSLSAPHRLLYSSRSGLCLVS